MFQVDVRRIWLHLRRVSDRGGARPSSISRRGSVGLGAIVGASCRLGNWHMTYVVLRVHSTRNTRSYVTIGAMSLSRDFLCYTVGQLASPLSWRDLHAPSSQLPPPNFLQHSSARPHLMLPQHCSTRATNSSSVGSILLGMPASALSVCFLFALPCVLLRSHALLCRVCCMCRVYSCMRRIMAHVPYAYRERCRLHHS